MAILGPGTPLRIGQDNIWRGNDKTNGFLMRNVDGRIPALKESMSRIDISAANVLAASGAIPYGNGLWRDMNTFATMPGALVAQGGPGCVLIGILEFNQGLQTGHPIQNWGIPTYMRTDMIRGGYVGYKVTKAAGASAGDYLKYLQGDRTMDIPTVRETWTEWVAKVSGTTPVLSIAFEVATGFPVMIAWDGTTWSAANTLAKAGNVIITESENTSVFIDFKAQLGGAR